MLEWIYAKFGGLAGWELVTRLDNDAQGGLMHRLDKQTSGLVLMARTERGFDAAKANVECQHMVKDYVCLVHGAF